jgi:Nucleotide-diphospho-sugar transferase
VNRTGGTYIYPNPASRPAFEQCFGITQNKSTMEQLDDVLSYRIVPEKDTGMIAFTITDYNYARDMIHDIVQMFEEVVGFPRNSFFFVALDVATVELACRHNYPVISWNNDDNLKDAVANTKLVISRELAKRGMPFFFSEMDVFWLRTPKPSLLTFLDSSVEVMFSGHQNNPWAPNIGVYASKANDRTLEYFGHCLDILSEKPQTHDQYVMVSMDLFAPQNMSARTPNLNEHNHFLSLTRSSA